MPPEKKCPKTTANTKRLILALCGRRPEPGRGFQAETFDDRLKGDLCRIDRKNIMRLGPATQAASYVDSWSAVSPHGGGMTASARQRPFRGATFAKAACRFAILRSRNCNRCGLPAVLSCFEKQGEEAAMPGQPSRTRARFWNFPLATHSRELPAAAGSTAIIQRDSGTLTFR